MHASDEDPRGEPDDEEAHDDDEPAVEVERLPNLGGWETFKGIDAAGDDERFTVVLRHASGVVEYAFFPASAAEPEATGVLEPSRAIDELIDEDRVRLVRAVLAKHDPSFGEYGSRLVFELEPPSLEGEQSDDDAEPSVLGALEDDDTDD